MAAIVTTQQLEANYDKFIAELTQLSRKYGVAIQSVGGVILADNPGEFRDVTYVADITSGDLLPEFPSA
jgi:hypothetical protein